MKTKKILSLLLVFGFVSVCFLLCGFTFFKKKSAPIIENTKKEMQNYSEIKNDLWCVTFQLVWNEFMQKFSNGEPIKFENGNPPIADELNKKFFTKEILSENSYYIEQGEISKSLKRKIEKNIKKKFNEKSDILSMINWNVKNSYLFYSMLNKKFNYNVAFDKLPLNSFNGPTEKINFFGINSDSDKQLRKNLDVLFYNSSDEYAIRLLTKENENVILYRTDKNDSFIDLFDYIKTNSNYSEFTSKDNLKIPVINVDKTISYNDLQGKKIQNSDYVISQAIQTIKFKLDEKGGSLKSEAALTVMKTALRPEPVLERNFFFDKAFYLFLIEQGSDKPYYAMKVDSTEYLQKE